MLSKIWIKQFRNLEEIVLEVPAETNFFIFGQNNQGKTNFLEAVYFLGNGKSPRHSDHITLINYDQTEAFIGADYEKSDSKRRLYLKITADGKKSGVINNKGIKHLSALRRELNIEYISADVIRIFQEYPDFRRKDMDRFLSVFDSEYESLLRDYERVIKQKNLVLKLGQAKQNTEIWNEKLVMLAVEIVDKRVAYLEAVGTVLAPFVKSITGIPGKIDLLYLTKSLILPQIDRITYETILRCKLSDSIEKEYRVGYSLYGPHRDDFDIVISDKPLFNFYSRGINRIVAMLLKLSQLIMLDRAYQSFPILLLDDTFAEVDKSKKIDLMALLERECRFFYTSVLPEDKDLFTGPVRDYQMENGRLINGSH